MSAEEQPQLLHPYCNTCGWRKGGPDAWRGNACKCGLWEPPMAPTTVLHPCDVNQPPVLTCHRCREIFDRPFDEFFYRDRNGPFGWRKWCKACYSESPSIIARTKRRT